MPEICQVFKIYIMMRVIANYAHKRITDLVSPKSMCILIFVSILASLPPFILLQFIEINKWLTLFFSLSIFLIDYYVLCWIFKVSYREILGGFIRQESKFAPILKLLP